MSLSVKCHENKWIKFVCDFFFFLFFFLLMHAYWCGTRLFGCDWPGLVTFWPTPWWTPLGRFIPLGRSPGPGCRCGLFTRAATMNGFFIHRRTFWNVLVARRGRFLIHHFVTVKRKRAGQLSHKVKRSLSVPVPWSGAQCTEPIDHVCVHVSLCSLMVFICLFIYWFVCLYLCNAGFSFIKL